MPADTILEQLDRLIQRARSIDLLVDDGPSSLALAAASAPAVLVLLDMANQLLDSIQAHYDSAVPAEVSDHDTGQGTGDQPGSDLGRIATEVSSEIAGKEIGSVACATARRLGLVARLLESADADADQLSTVMLCETALRQLRRGLLSLEAAICECEKRKPPVRSWSDLATSLETRRLYGELRRDLFPVTSAPSAPGVATQPGFEPQGEELVDRLSQLAVRLSELRATEVFPSLRIDDRLQIRKLAERLDLWLADRNPDTGRRLWQDLTTFGNLLMEINNRQELQDHDRRVVADTHLVLCEGTPPAQVPPALLARLRQVLGRDDELDHLILEHEQHPMEAWQEPLRRLLAVLGHPDQVE